MERILKFLVDLIAAVHDWIMSLNDGYEWGLDDKEMHFAVIGLLGIGLFFAVQILFKWLAKRSVTAISWIYTFTVVLVVTFAIEAGQRVSGIGQMESMDIYYGVWGFIVAFGIYLAVKGFFLLLRHIFAGRKEEEIPPGVRHFIGDRVGGRKR